MARVAAGDPRMLVGTDDGRVLLYDLDDPTAAPMVVADGLEPVWGVAGVDGDTAVVGSGGDLTLIDVHPTHGRRRVAVVLAETSDQPALGAGAAATLRTAWQNEVFDGVTRGGVLESARRYWRAVSDDQIDLVQRRCGRRRSASRQLGVLRHQHQRCHWADRRLERLCPRRNHRRTNAERQRRRTVASHRGRPDDR